SSDAENAGGVRNFRANSVKDAHGVRHVIERTKVISRIREFDAHAGATFKTTESGKLKPVTDSCIMGSPIGSIAAGRCAEHFRHEFFHVHTKRTVNLLHFFGVAVWNVRVSARCVSYAFTSPGNADRSGAGVSACDCFTGCLHTRHVRPTSTTRRTTRSTSNNGGKHHPNTVQACRVTK